MSAADKAVDQISGEWSLHTYQSCFDFLLENKKQIKKLPIEIDLGWVKGHQKGEKKWWSRMNPLMDLRAKVFLF